MNINDLRKNLTITGEQVLITSATADGKFPPFFQKYLGGKTVTVSNAKLGPDDSRNHPSDTQDTVQIVGTPSALMLTNPTFNISTKDASEITATFKLDAAGNVSAVFSYEMREAGTGHGSEDWKFSNSLPELPTTFDFNTSLTDPQTSPLDDLKPLSAWFYVTTDDIQIPDALDSKNPPIKLSSGINFVGIIIPSLALLIFEELFAGKDKLLIYGLVVLEGNPHPLALPDKVNNFPWEENYIIPSVTLKANLGIEIKLSDVMTLGNTFYHLFTPLTGDFWKANTSYEPFTAFTSEILIPKLSPNPIGLASKIPKGLKELVIIESFDDLTLADLSDLVDLAGTSKLISFLPPEIQKLGKDIGKLQLLDIGIALSGGASPSAGAHVGIKYVYITVGMPDLDWLIGAKGEFEFKGFEVAFIITDPFGKSNKSVGIDAQLMVEGAPIEITSGYPNFFISGSLQEKQSLDLSKLMGKYLPGLPTPTPLTINAMDVNIDPINKSFNFYTQMANDPSWKFDLGKNGLTISDVSFGFAKAFGAEGYEGQFQGTIQYNDDITLFMSYIVPGNFVIRADFENVKLSGLVDWLVNSKTNVLPGGFDLDFVESTLVITKDNDTEELYFATQVTELGSFCFVLRKEEGGSWGYAVGLDMTIGTLGKLPGLSSLKPFVDAFPFSNMMVAVSTIADPEFTFPEMSIFNNPNITSKQIKLPASVGGTQEGFYFYAMSNFGQTKVLRNIAKLFGIPSDTQLQAGLFVGEDPEKKSQLNIDISSEISKGTYLTAGFGAGLTNSQLSFFLVGKVNTSIQSQSVEFDVQLLVVENGAFISGDMVVSGQKKTIDFSIFKLNNLAIEAGISFEGEPSLGFAAELDVAHIDTSIAVFIDSENPSQSMAAGSVSDITLRTIFDDLTGETDALPSFMENILGKIGLKGYTGFSGSLATYGAALNNYDFLALTKMFAAGGVTLPSSSSQILLIVDTPSEKWFVTDMSTMTHYELTASDVIINVEKEAQFYCAPQPTQIANINFPMGMHISGTLDYLILQASLDAEIVANKGLGIDAEIAPITVGSSALFSVTGADGKGGPQLVLCTFTDAKNINPNFRKPEFKVSGEVSILGMVDSLDIDISDDGFKLNVSDKSVFGLELDLDITIDGLQDMSATGKAELLVPSIPLGPLGTLNLNTDVEADLSFGSKKNEVYASAGFDLKVLGIEIGPATLTLEVSDKTLENLGAEIIAEIEKLALEIFDDVKKWLNFVKNGLIKGFEDLKKLGEFLASYYKLLYKQAAILLKDVGYLVEDVEKILVEGFSIALDEAKKLCDFLYNELKDCASETGLLASSD